MSRVKSLYDDLKLREAYAKYEEAAHGDILGLVQQLRHGADKGKEKYKKSWLFTFL